MIRVALELMGILLLYGCVTLPDGDLQLAPRLVKDRRSQRETGESLKCGRPLFVEVQCYPRLATTGDLLGQGTILMNIGREVVSLDEVLDTKKAK